MLPTKCLPQPNIKGWTTVKYNKPLQIDTGYDDGFYSFYWYLKNTTGDRCILPPKPSTLQNQTLKDTDNNDDDD